MGQTFIRREIARGTRLAIVIPAFNEQACLRLSLKRLVEFLPWQAEFDPAIIVADNGSADQTFEIASRFATDHSRVSVLHLSEKGRGRALKQAWLNSNADILAYMDADLSTHLEALPKLIEPLISGQYDLATGSRLLEPKLTTRCLQREFTSRCYNLLIKLMFRTTFSDAQCGFKAITRSAAQALLPQVQDTGWFFDTELLLLAEKQGYRIFDLPVRWTERRASHVHIFRTALEDIKGLLRLRRSLRANSGFLEANGPFFLSKSKIKNQKSKIRPNGWLTELTDSLTDRTFKIARFYRGPNGLTAKNKYIPPTHHDSAQP